MDTGMGLRVDPLMDEILRYLKKGRATTGALVDWTDSTRATVSKRLDKLMAADCIEYAHEPTALWVLVDDPREDGGNDG
jgi:predicted HTH transcriptional regulator